MNNIELFTIPTLQRIDFIDSKIFGGGERHIQLNLEYIPRDTLVDVCFFYDGDNSVIDLLMVVDALRQASLIPNTLFIPYFPGGRQDRVCNVGEALSVKVYAQLINSCKFKKVQILDPHSDVTVALVDSSQALSNEFLVRASLEKIKDMVSVEANISLVSPDAGSNKKVFSIAKQLANSGTIYNVIRADKIRDVSSGKIVDTQVLADSLTGQTCVIIDDICSYGGTFRSLSAKLKEKGAEQVYLIVTHYEGVANIEQLKESGINAIFTTNSFKGRIPAQQLDRDFLYVFSI